MSEVMGVSKLERLFREAAGLDIDKSDLKRLSDFIDDRLRSLLIIAQGHASANGRDIIEPWDFPITDGLQRAMREFEALDTELALAPILERLAKMPTLRRAYSDETKSCIPQIVGALTICLARIFKTIEPGLKNPRTEEWDRARRVFEILL
jgi:hypothetical protein